MKLFYLMMKCLLNLFFRLIESRVSKKSFQNNDLHKYHIDFWFDKLMSFFVWNNVKSLDKLIYQNWQRTFFWTLTRKLVFIISNELNAENHIIFLQKITFLTVIKLWIILHYDSQQLSIRYIKDLTYHDINTQEIVQTLTFLQRT